MGYKMKVLGAGRSGRPPYRIYILVNRNWMRYNRVEYPSRKEATMAARLYAWANGHRIITKS